MVKAILAVVLITVFAVVAMGMSTASNKQRTRLTAKLLRRPVPAAGMRFATVRTPQQAVDQCKNAGVPLLKESQFSQWKEIACGNFGCVYSAKYTTGSTSQMVAVKMLKDWAEEVSSSPTTTSSSSASGITEYQETLPGPLTGYKSHVTIDAPAAPSTVSTGGYEQRVVAPSTGGYEQRVVAPSSSSPPSPSPADSSSPFVKKPVQGGTYFLPSTSSAAAASSSKSKQSNKHKLLFIEMETETKPDTVKAGTYETATSAAPKKKKKRNSKKRVKEPKFGYTNPTLTGASTTSTSEHVVVTSTSQSQKVNRAADMKKTAEFVHETLVAHKLQGASHVPVLVGVMMCHTQEPIPVTTACAVSELMEGGGGSLEKALTEGWFSTASAIDTYTKLWIGSEMAKAVKELHDKKILHNDISTRNFLISKSSAGVLKIKITDFGLAQEMQRVRGTKEWVAPPAGEMFFPPWEAPPERFVDGNKCGFFSDVYMVGSALWELYRIEKPWSCTNMDASWKDQVRQHGLSADVRFIPRDVAKIIQLCTQPDPTRRPTIEAVIGFLDKLAIAAKKKVRNGKAQPTATAVPNFKYPTCEGDKSSSASKSSSSIFKFTYELSRSF